MIPRRIRDAFRWLFTGEVDTAELRLLEARQAIRSMVYDVIQAHEVSGRRPVHIHVTKEMASTLHPEGTEGWTHLWGIPITVGSPAFHIEVETGGRLARANADCRAMIAAEVHEKTTGAHAATHQEHPQMVANDETEQARAALTAYMAPLTDEVLAALEFVRPGVFTSILQHPKRPGTCLVWPGRLRSLIVFQGLEAAEFPWSDRHLLHPHASIAVAAIPPVLARPTSDRAAASPLANDASIVAFLRGTTRA